MFRLLMWLESNPGWWTAKVAAHRVGFANTTACNYLRRLERQGKVEKRGSNPAEWRRKQRPANR